MVVTDFHRNIGNKTFLLQFLHKWRFSAPRQSGWFGLLWFDTYILIHSCTIFYDWGKKIARKLKFYQKILSTHNSLVIFELFWFWLFLHWHTYLLLFLFNLGWSCWFMKYTYGPWLWCLLRVTKNLFFFRTTMLRALINKSHSMFNKKNQNVRTLLFSYH